MLSSSSLVFFPFIALPNGGKGTQTQLLSERLGLARLDMGSLLRAIGKEASPLGERVQSRLAQGQLVSLDIVLDVLEDGVQKQLAATSETKPVQGFILDGFPRSLEQAEALLGLVTKLKGSIGSAIYLEVPVDVVQARAESRRVCEACGAIYSLLNKPPSVENVCDSCGHSPLSHRQDDQPEQVAKRLLSFQEETQPVLDFFKKQGLLKVVNGHREVEAVYQDLKTVMLPLLSLVSSNV
jgi:adenylate kinase